MSVVALMILFLLIVPTYWLSHIVSTHDGELSSNANSLCIGILLLFTLLFSTVLSLFTSARRHEILASAAASVFKHAHQPPFANKNYRYCAVRRLRREKVDPYQCQTNFSIGTRGVPWKCGQYSGSLKYIV